MTKCHKLAERTPKNILGLIGLLPAIWRKFRKHRRTRRANSECSQNPLRACPQQWGPAARLQHHQCGHSKCSAHAGGAKCLRQNAWLILLPQDGEFRLRLPESPDSVHSTKADSGQTLTHNAVKLICRGVAFELAQFFQNNSPLPGHSCLCLGHTSLQCW